MSLEMHVVSKIPIMAKFKINKLGNMAPLHKAWCHDCEKRTIVEWIGVYWCDLKTKFCK